jgi:hypothetical protein
MIAHAPSDRAGKNSIIKICRIAKKMRHVNGFRAGHALSSAAWVMAREEEGKGYMARAFTSTAAQSLAAWVMTREITSRA